MAQKLHPQMGIVGGGWAGLSAAAFLSHHGVPVTLFERADSLGGCAGDYRLAGCLFPTGATVAFGMEENHGALRSFLDEMQITVRATHLDHPMDIILPDRVVRLDANEAGQADEWARAFPTISREVGRLMRQVGAIARTLYPLVQARTGWPVLSLGEGGRAARILARHPGSWAALARYFNRPFISLLADNHLHPSRSPNIRAFTTMLDALLLDSIQAGLETGSALLGALALDMYRRHSFTIEGGMARIAQELAARVIQGGGRIQTQSKVRSCQWSAQDQQWTVSTRLAESYHFNAILNATGLPLPGPTSSSQSLVSEPPHLTGAFRVDGIIPLCKLPRDIAENLPRAYQIVEPSLSGEPALIHGGTYLTFHSGACHDTQAIVWTATAHTVLSAWMPRLAPDEYHRRKSQAVQRILSACSRVVPGLGDLSTLLQAASPVTYARFLQKSAVGGMALTSGWWRNTPGPHTVWPHLYQAGDTVFPGPGSLSAALSGIRAARAILAGEF